MSVGVHVLASLVEKAMAALGPSFDVEVVEVHHRAKVDAPSGTAIRLGDVVKHARHGHYVHGREGRPGPRKPDEVGMHAVRGGDVIGDHTVFFFGDGERIELTHRASSRDLFAHGAVRAAGWIAGKPAGRYRLADMLLSGAPGVARADARPLRTSRAPRRRRSSRADLRDDARLRLRRRRLVRLARARVREEQERADAERDARRLRRASRRAPSAVFASLSIWMHFGVVRPAHARPSASASRSSWRSPRRRSAGRSSVNAS